MGQDRARLRQDQHADPDVDGERRPAPCRAPLGHAVPGRGGRQRRPQLSRRRASARRYWRPTSLPSCSNLLGARARKEGLDIETRVMDGHALELDDNSFDMAGSQFGVMLFPDMPQGHPRDGARRQAGRPRADERVRRPAQDRVLRLLRGRRSVGPPGLHRPADGSSSARRSSCGSGEAARGARRRRTEGHQGRDHHRDHGVPDREGAVGVAGVEQPDRRDGARRS